VLPIGCGSIEMSSRQNGRTVRVYCANCDHLLYKYRKSGAGRLVKCFRDGIVQDNTEGNLRCPSCGQAFARETMAYGRPANEIIQGKVTVRR
jgi:ribosomal protein S27E